MDKQAAALAIQIARAFVDTGTFVADKPHTAEAHIRGLATLLEKALAELSDGNSKEPHNLLLQMQQQLGTPIGEVRVETLDGKLYHYTNWPPEVEAARSKSQPAMGSGAEPIGVAEDCSNCAVSGMTIAMFPASLVPAGTKLYTHPAPTAQDSRLLQQRIEELEYIEVELRRQLQAAWAFNGEFQVPEVAVHYWQGDGEDHLESLCSGVPVVIEAQTLRELLAARDSKVPEDFIKRVIYLVNGHEEAVAEGNHGDAKDWMRQLQNLLVEKK